MNYAAIDIGSNTMLLTIVSETNELLHDEAHVVGMGKGLGDRGVFLTERMRAGEEVLRNFIETAATFDVHARSIRAVSTSAARRAMNAQTWFNRIEQDLGLKIQIISGQEEARLTWRGALRELPHVAGPILVVDLGGGSTELIQGQMNQVTLRKSLELGSVRLTEQFFPNDLQSARELGALREHVQQTLQQITWDSSPALVIGVAGTVTTLATIGLELTEWNADKVQNSEMSISDL